jgi:hypothetical protein
MRPRTKEKKEKERKEKNIERIKEINRERWWSCKE